MDVDIVDDSQYQEFVYDDSDVIVAIDMRPPDVQEDDDMSEMTLAQSERDGSSLTHIQLLNQANDEMNVPLCLP